MYLSTITMTNIYQQFYLQDGSKDQLPYTWNKIMLLAPYVSVCIFKSSHYYWAVFFTYFFLSPIYPTIYAFQQPFNTCLCWPIPLQFSSFTCSIWEPLRISSTSFYGPDIIPVKTSKSVSNHWMVHKELTPTSGLASLFLHSPMDSWSNGR